MKNRSIKEYCVEVAFVIWVVLIFISIICLDKYGIIAFAYTIIGMLVMLVCIGMKNKNELESKNECDDEVGTRNENLQELKEQYRCYLDLVYKQTMKHLSKIEDSSLNLQMNTEPDYLVSFSDTLNLICDKKSSGKPDSFIIASCLMYSILNYPVVSKDEEEVLKGKNDINLEIAMECVLDIICEPITYYEENGEWIEKKHPKVYKAAIKEVELYNQIINTIQQEKISDIMQFANLLHMIYLNCK